MPSDQTITGITADVEILSRETAYKRFFRMDILALRHRLFRGGMSPPIEREVFVRRPAVAVLPFDPAAGTVVLVEQFRIGAMLADLPAWQLEVIAGLVEPGESALGVARREALEEAGCTIQDPIEVFRYLTSPGGTSEVVTFICARTDASAVAGLHGLADEHEDIRVHVMPLEEAMHKCSTGQITNALTIIALQWLTLNRPSLPEAWQ
jgi:ADP-ribose pyrophosphatase